jgi:hypothetical protein
MLIRLLCSSCGRACERDELRRMRKLKEDAGGEGYLACPDCKGEVTGAITQWGWLFAAVWLAVGITLISWAVGKTYRVPMPDNQERVVVRAGG